MTPGVRHVEHLQGRFRDAFVGLEAALRGLLQRRVARSLQVQLDLGQLLDPVARLPDDAFDLGGGLLDGGTALAQIGGERVLAGHLLADE